MLPQPTRAKYVASSDELIVEDMVSRVVLTGNIAKDELVTGNGYVIRRRRWTREGVSEGRGGTKEEGRGRLSVK